MARVRPQSVFLAVACLCLVGAVGSIVPKVIARRHAASERVARVPALPVLGVLPEFHLVDQTGAPRSRTDLLGKPAIADFVFLNCSDVCPRLTARMGELGRRLAARGLDARLVTVSVDPTNDTPARLATYAASVGADPARWTFLTGPADEIERTVVSGFKIAMGTELAPGKDGKTEILQIFHGEHLVLLDRAARIRGYYDADDAGLAALEVDLGRLAAEASGPARAPRE